MIPVQAQCADYDALLRKSFKRHDFIAQAFYLIVAGTAINCSIVLQNWYICKGESKIYTT